MAEPRNLLLRLSLLAAFALTVVASPAKSLIAAEPERPIIAEIVDAPGAYDGHEVLIYGLVVDSDPDRHVFYLQDVSQRPLAIVAASTHLPVTVGDQLEVLGTIKAGPGDLQLLAERISPTKVLGGGGCC